MKQPPILVPGQHPFDISSKLADHEKQEVEKSLKAHLDKISTLSTSIEKILIENEATWSDFREVIQRFNERNMIVTDKLSIKEISERFYANART